MKQKAGFTSTDAKARVTTDTPAIPAALRNFDHLPDSGMIRLPVVAALFACSPATVWRRCKAGELPKPRSLGANTTVWNVGEIRRALRGVKA